MELGDLEDIIEAKDRAIKENVNKIVTLADKIATLEEVIRIKDRSMEYMEKTIDVQRKSMGDLQDIIGYGKEKIAELESELTKGETAVLERLVFGVSITDKE
jgi:chromosome segregation ATPase